MKIDLSMLSKLFSHILILFYCTHPAYSEETKIIPTYSIPHYNQEIQKLYQIPAARSKQLSTRLNFMSGHFLGMKYLEGALGEGPQGEIDKNPLYRTDAFDCMTYVSTVLALVESTNLNEFIRNIKKINYRNNSVNYVERNHFVEMDWNEKNHRNGFLNDITATLVDTQGLSIANEATVILEKPAWYQKKMADTLKYFTPLKTKKIQRLLAKLHTFKTHNVKSTIVYIPIARFFTAKGTPNLFLFNQIPNGAVIEIITQWNLKPFIGTNLNVVHMGIAIRNQHGLIFREASSIAGNVTDVLLSHYLFASWQSKTPIKGINIQRINFLNPANAYDSAINKKYKY